MGGLVIEGKHAYIPADTSTSRLGDTVKAYLESHPEARGVYGHSAGRRGARPGFPGGI